MGNLPHVLFIWASLKRSFHKGNRKKQLVAAVLMKESWQNEWNRRSTALQKFFRMKSFQDAHSFISPTSCLHWQEQAVTLPPVFRQTAGLWALTQKWFCPNLTPSSDIVYNCAATDHQTCWTNTGGGINHLSQSAQRRAEEILGGNTSLAAEVFRNQLWKLQLAMNSQGFYSWS